MQSFCFSFCSLSLHLFLSRVVRIIEVPEHIPASLELGMITISNLAVFSHAFLL